MNKHNNQKRSDTDSGQTFSVVRFRDADDTYCFTSHENTFFEISNTYYQTVRDDVGKYTLDSLGDSYWERNYIPEEVFHALCEAQQVSNHISVIVDFDFENDRVSFCDADHNHKTYDLEDIAGAIAEVNQRIVRDMADCCCIFSSLLDGKEIDESESAVLQM